MRLKRKRKSIRIHIPEVNAEAEHENMEGSMNIKDRNTDIKDLHMQMRNGSAEDKLDRLPLLLLEAEKNIEDLMFLIHAKSNTTVVVGDKQDLLLLLPLLAGKNIEDLKNQDMQPTNEKVEDKPDRHLLLLEEKNTVDLMFPTPPRNHTILDEQPDRHLHPREDQNSNLLLLHHPTPTPPTPNPAEKKSTKCKPKERHAKEHTRDFARAKEFERRISGDKSKKKKPKPQPQLRQG